METSGNLNEVNESFIQTYLIISGLLLTHIQNTENPLLDQSTELLSTLNQTDNTQNILDALIFLGNSGFILFLIFILIYKIAQKIDLSDFFKCIIASIASIGLSLQITSSLNLQTLISSGINEYMLSVPLKIIIFLLLPLIIVCTLVPSKYFRHILLSHLIFTGIIIILAYQKLLLIYIIYLIAIALYCGYKYIRGHPC